jgi:hypothetical protein
VEIIKLTKKEKLYLYLNNFKKNSQKGYIIHTKEDDKKIFIYFFSCLMIFVATLPLLFFIEPNFINIVKKILTLNVIFLFLMFLITSFTVYFLFKKHIFLSKLLT